jgi:hypothetical protein
MDTVRQRHWWNFERRIMNSIFTLKQWIVAATKNLTSTAISSITKEITDHYQTSLEKYEARGISSIEAESLAVRDLGDPEKSASKFVQVYLTKDENEKIKKIENRVYGIKAIFGVFLYGSVNIVPSLMFFDGIFNYFEFKFLILPMYFFLTYSVVILIHIFDFIIGKNLNDKKFTYLVTKVKLFTIISSFVLIFICFILNLPNAKFGSYVPLAFFSFIATDWMKNTYPILRKYSKEPQRTPSI